MTTITAYLVRDHARLHGLLELASAAETVDGAAFEAFRAGLLRHIGIEEKILFPAVRRVRGGVPLEEAVALRVDHAALTSLLVPSPDKQLCHEIASLLAVHDAKEEGPSGVYVACDQHLAPEVSRELARRADAAPIVPLAPHNDGPEVLRTAEAALASARRIRAARAR